jgi:hypothetical protein
LRIQAAHSVHIPDLIYLPGAGWTTLLCYDHLTSLSSRLGPSMRGCFLVN